MATEGEAAFPSSQHKTGRYLVLLRQDAVGEAQGELRKTAGVRVATTADSKTGALTAKQREGAGGVIFDRLGVAVVDAAPDQVQALGTAAQEQSTILAVEPERVVYALEAPGIPGAPRAPLPDAPLTPHFGRGLSAEYLSGYRDAVVNLSAVGGVPSGASIVTPTAAAAAVDESKATWGLQAVGALSSGYTGRGVKVAVLDTGLDVGHPDFQDRTIETRSFVPGEEVRDGNGHGTHTIGTACGSRIPADLPRYGVAFDADIWAGKVLGDRGSGNDEGILAGIEWAVAGGCAIVSMSLGSPTFPGEPHSPVYETAARRALALGTCIIAAAGNESRRDQGVISPVSHPANCPSIPAVAALDAQLQVAPFSNRGLDPVGGQVDVAGPGVLVHSSWPMPTRYRTISGTSMATPHVAGVGALLAEANPDVSAGELLAILTRSARRLPLPSTDVGSGLAQAP